MVIVTPWQRKAFVLRKFSKWVKALYKDNKKLAKRAFEQHAYSDSYNSAITRQLKSSCKECRKFPVMHNKNIFPEQKASRQVPLTILENICFLWVKTCLFSLILLTVLCYTILYFSIFIFLWCSYNLSNISVTY